MFSSVQMKCALVSHKAHDPQVGTTMATTKYSATSGQVFFLLNTCRQDSTVVIDCVRSHNDSVQQLEVLLFSVPYYYVDVFVSENIWYRVIGIMWN